ncbi:unnamed protein product [Lymnaea stagnalis]|uniref:JmjC domain-containing protein n=1 Tax=Lymnaea stagnalis TaxID=6523 RepID=A0AAV2HEQ1_LYMST
MGAVHKSTQYCPHTTNENDECGNVSILDIRIMFEDLHKKAISMGIQQNHFCRLQFVIEAKRDYWKLRLLRLLKAIACLTSVLAACVVLWLADWPIARSSLAVAILGFRGKSGASAESEGCLVHVPHSVQDLATPPIGCEFCQGVQRVARESRLSSADFTERYAYSGRPAVITDGAANWSALAVFNFEFFKGIYGPYSPVLKDSCQFFPYRTEFENLSHVFQMDDDRIHQKDGSAPWYIGWSNCDIDATNILRQHYSRPYFLPEDSESSKTDWLFMGSPGYGAHMHVDNVEFPSWQAQITGHKLWTLEPPAECYFVCEPKLEVTVHPGEIIVLDTNKWYHSTLVVGDDISITIGSEYD